MPAKWQKVYKLRQKRMHLHETELCTALKAACR